MSAARSAELRPQHRWAAKSNIGNGWHAGRPGLQSKKGQRTWAEGQHHWSDWHMNDKGGRDSWMEAEWQPIARYSQDFGLEAASSHDAGSRSADSQGVSSCWRKSAWSWDDYIVVKGSTVRVELSGAGLGDADLAALVRHLSSLMQRDTERTDGQYILNIDLSCNLYISDDGITEHLAPFLQRWPVCHRLKLYKTSIGDGALLALSSWAAGGYAHELHFSDLGGQVTGEAVFSFLDEVHQKGNYPYWNADGVRCALWLRLEHNAVPNTEKLVSRAQAQGMSLAVLQKPDLGQVRPGTQSGQRARDVPAVNLVLFHRQELRVSRQWIGSMVPMEPVPPELQGLLAAPGAPHPHGAEDRHCGPPFLEQFPGPSQRKGPGPKGRAGGAGIRVERSGGDRAVRPSRPFTVVMACPTSADDEVLSRWRWHLQSAEDPEWEARRILWMTSKLCDTGYLENISKASPQTLSSPATLSDDTSSGSSSDPMALDSAARFGRAVGPPGSPPPTRTVVVAACA